MQKVAQVAIAKQIVMQQASNEKINNVKTEGNSEEIIQDISNKDDEEKEKTVEKKVQKDDTVSITQKDKSNDAKSK